MYSLVNAPVLAFDLVRRPGGGSVAEVLLTALTLTRTDLPTLATVAPLDDEAHDRAWLAVSVAEAARRDVRRLATDARTAAAGGDAEATRSVLQALETAPIGSLDALLRCVRTDVLDWTWQQVREVAVQDATARAAAQVLCDAVAAGYLSGDLDDASRRELAGAWTRAQRLLPVRRDDLGPLADDVRHLLGQLRNADVDAVRALRRASARARAGGQDWAAALHDASWAAYLADRTRPAASAQLLAVTAVRSAGLDVGDLAGGVWNLVSGAVHACVVTDVVPEETWQTLVPPVLAALG